MELVGRSTTGPHVLASGGRSPLEPMPWQGAIYT